MTQPPYNPRYEDEDAPNFPSEATDPNTRDFSYRPEVINYKPQVGTFRQPSSPEMAVELYNRAYVTGAVLTNELETYIDNNGGVENFDFDSDGTVYRITTNFLDPDDPKVQRVPDKTATKMQKARLSAENDVEAIEKMFEKGGIFYATKSYVDTEKVKSDEVRRQFLDFLDRAKALYSFENEEQAWSMRADDQNAQNKKAAMEGYLNWDATPQYPNQRPYNMRISDIIRPTIPSELSPDYRLDGTGFDYETFGSAGGFGAGLPRRGIDYAVPGYAEGTPAANTPTGIDPEIAWMIGFNPVAPHSGGPFDPRGKQLRGWRDTSAQQGVMPQ